METPQKERNRKSPTVAVRLFSPEARVALNRRADAAGVTVSELLRSWVAEKLAERR